MVDDHVRMPDATRVVVRRIKPRQVNERAKQVVGRQAPGNDGERFPHRRDNLLILEGKIGSVSRTIVLLVEVERKRQSAIQHILDGCRQPGEVSA